MVMHETSQYVHVNVFSRDPRRIVYLPSRFRLERSLGPMWFLIEVIAAALFGHSCEKEKPKWTLCIKTMRLVVMRVLNAPYRFIVPSWFKKVDYIYTWLELIS